MSGFVAALHLARGQLNGITRLPAQPDDVARSFVAVAFASGPVVAVRLMMWWSDQGIPTNAWHLLAHDLMVFVVAWLGFAIVSHRLAERVGRSALWPRFMIVYNWCNVVANILMLAGSLPEILGAPTAVVQVAQLLVTGWALWFGWFAIRLTLRTGPLLALYFVLIEQAIGIAFTIAGASFAPK